RQPLPWPAGGPDYARHRPPAGGAGPARPIAPVPHAQSAPTGHVLLALAPGPRAARLPGAALPARGAGLPVVRLPVAPALPWLLPVPVAAPGPPCAGPEWYAGPAWTPPCSRTRSPGDHGLRVGGPRIRPTARVH